MCICNVYLCSYFFITNIKLALFGLNIHHSFYICYLERPCLYNREIILVALIRQNNKTNMTKNRDKIVKSLYKKIIIVILYFCHIAHPYF